MGINAREALEIAINAVSNSAGDNDGGNPSYDLAVVVKLKQLRDAISNDVQVVRHECVDGVWGVFPKRN